MSDFEYLFTPIKLGSVEVPNRIYMSPHGIGHIRGSDQEVAYMEARARGGAGVCVLATTMCTPMPDIYPGYFPRLCDRNEIPANARSVDAIHKAGAKAFIQGVWLTGAPGYPQPSGDAAQSLWAESQTRSMTTGEVQEVIELHALSGQNAWEAGADGVEFPIGGGSGLQCFTSPLYNKRTDQYGGSMENRARAVLEIIDGVRERCGRDFAIGFAVNADESVLGGPSLEEGVALCKLLADTGKIDFLRITARGQKPQTTQFHYPSSYLPQGTHLYAAAAVREVVDTIPIIGGGRITTAEFADQSIAEGQCDMVFMARALIADPEMPNKARRGQADEIRACIGDLEGCYMRAMFGQPYGCTVNPEMGCEWQGPVTPAEAPKTVAIIGGGPAGMEAAMVAAQRGHRVTLIEKEAALGGHVNVESALPGLGDRADLVRWLSLQIGKLGVDVRLNTEATAEFVESLGADEVILATGAHFSRLGITPDQLMAIPGHENANVLTPEDIIIGGKPVGENVVVYDTTGYIVGPGVAEMLADQGKNVTLVTTHTGMARSTVNLGINVVLSMRVMPKVDFVRDTSVTGIGETSVDLMNLYTFEPTTVDADTVVLVTSRPPQDGLYHELLGRVENLHIIGDARESRYNVFCTDDAIKDGKRTALAL